VVGPVEVAVATCIYECRPSLGCRGDVGDGTVKDPRSCGDRAIPVVDVRALFLY
jgi:hypothetical protein